MKTVLHLAMHSAHRFVGSSWWTLKIYDGLIYIKVFFYLSNFPFFWTYNTAFYLEGEISLVVNCLSTGKQTKTGKLFLVDLNM